MACDAWWRANRDADNLFADELSATIARLSLMPTMGKPQGVRDGALVRRALMPKTQTHVYYAVDRSQRLVSVLAVWGARKRGEPPL